MTDATPTTSTPIANGPVVLRAFDATSGGLALRPSDFYKPLQVRDESLRNTAVTNIIDRLRKLEKDNVSTLAALLPTALRLSYEWSLPRWYV
jgi:hypothetical protein